MARAGAIHEQRTWRRALRSRGRGLVIGMSLLTAGAWLTACNLAPVSPPATPRVPSSPVALARVTPAPNVPGNPDAGRVLFTDSSVFAPSGCGSCHTLPGITSGEFPFAPNLNNVALRPTLAGDQVANTPQNLKQWIQDPQSVKPDAKMPKPNVTAQQAEDLAAFLYAYPYNAAGR
jgi:cytochrome c